MLVVAFEIVVLKLQLKSKLDGLQRAKAQLRKYWLAPGRRHKAW